MLPTKVGNSPSDDGDTEVQGTAAGTLPHTGAGLPTGLLLIVSFGLILVGGALLLLPGLTLQKAGGDRRH